MNRVNRIATITCAFVGVMVMSLAHAEGKAAPASELRIDGVQLVRAGTGALRRFGIKGCDVTLFVGVRVRRDQVLDNVPKALELNYVHALRSDQFARAAVKTLRRNFSDDEIEVVAEGIERMHALYQNVSKGDHYTLAYIPARGTTLSLNGKLLGTVPGEAFARAYFSIWLGAKPIGTKCRDRMLAGVPVSRAKPEGE